MHHVIFHRQPKYALWPTKLQSVWPSGQLSKIFFNSAVVEGAIKGYLAVTLTEDAAKALTAKLGMAEMFGHIQPNLGKVVLYWMGENADWELRELVEGLVFSRSLGRHTTALCAADQGM